jgi:hypothetical protein
MSEASHWPVESEDEGLASKKAKSMTATVGSEGVVGAMSEFGIRRGFQPSIGSRMSRERDWGGQSLVHETGLIVS